MTKKTLTGPCGIYVELDTSDPHTPAMVYSKHNRDVSASWDCATGEGCLSGRQGDMEIHPSALDWLNALSDEVEEVFEEARKDHPDYQ